MWRKLICGLLLTLAGCGTTVTPAVEPSLDGEWVFWTTNAEGQNLGPECLAIAGDTVLDWHTVCGSAQGQQIGTTVALLNDGHVILSIFFDTYVDEILGSVNLWAEGEMLPDGSVVGIVEVNGTIGLTLIDAHGTFTMIRQ